MTLMTLRKRYLGVQISCVTECPLKCEVKRENDGRNTLQLFDARVWSWRTRKKLEETIKQY
jgi:hypothetical protein